MYEKIYKYHHRMENNDDIHYMDLEYLATETDGHRWNYYTKNSTTHSRIYESLGYDPSIVHYENEDYSTMIKITAET